MKSIEEQCKLAHDCYLDMACLDTQLKNQTLRAMAESVLDQTDAILTANKLDMKEAKKSGMSTSLQDRLCLNKQRIHDMATSILEIKSLPDPIGDTLDSFTRPNGLKITKKRVPLGVIGIIYEARPNVTADALALCVKTGNAVVLRGSASAYQTNLAITTAIKQAAKAMNIPEDALQLLENTRRSSVQTFVTMDQYLNLVIPRGGASLIQTVVQHATVPCIETGVGNCHVYIDGAANLEHARDIVINSKTHRPSVCNACETVLLDASLPERFKKELIESLLDKKVELRGCDQCMILSDTITSAQTDDWNCEYNDLILAIKVVDGAADAIAHIQQHGSHHTEAIVSENQETIDTFIQHIDAACITINASTRFTDGGEFGYGAEIGISTQKLHARGPMGLNELCSYKYVVVGQGHCR